MLQNKFVRPILILFLTGLLASDVNLIESNTKIVTQETIQVQAPNKYEWMEVESEKFMAFFILSAVHLLPKLPYFFVPSTALGALIFFAMDYLIHVVDQWIHKKFTGQFKKPVCVGLAVLGAGYTSILSIMYFYRFLIFFNETAIPRAMGAMEMGTLRELFLNTLVPEFIAAMSKPSTWIDASTDMLVKVFVTGMAVAIVFFPGIVLRWTVFAPVRFTSWVAHFPRVKSVLRWIVDNLAIFFLYSILSGIPVSLQIFDDGPETFATIATIATSGIIHIGHKAFDKVSRRLPEMRGKTLVVSGTKFLISVYMFPAIFNAIDASIFHMYNWREINGFKTPDLEIEGVLSQAKHDFETCKRMKSNWPYANPKVGGICDRYSRERLENDFRKINYFPKQGDIYDVKDCRVNYLKCAVKNHPDKRGTNDKLKLCTTLKEKCELGNSCGEK